MQKCMWTDVTFANYLYMQITNTIDPHPHQQPR
jgi:hypothetical protein